MLLAPLSLTPLMKYEWVHLRHISSRAVLKRSQIGQMADDLILHIKDLAPIEDYGAPDPDSVLTFYEGGKVPAYRGQIGFWYTLRPVRLSISVKIGDEKAEGDLDDSKVWNCSGANLSALVNDIDAIGEALKDSPKPFILVNLQAMARLGDKANKYLRTIEEFSRNQDKDIALEAMSALKQIEHK